MFSKRSNLKAHSRVHSGVLPYPCEFPGCTKRFRWKSSLKPHIKVHQQHSNLELENLAASSVSSATASGTPLLSDPSVEKHVINSSSSTLLPMSEGTLRPSSPRPQPSPTAINQSTALESTAWTQHTPEGRRYFCSYPACNATFVRFSHLLDHENSSVHYPQTKPNTSRALFSNEVEQNLSMDIRTSSVLSESSDETDVLSFTFSSPRVDAVPNTEVPISDLTENLWKSELHLDDPFGDFSMGFQAKDADLLGMGDTNYNGVGLSSASVDMMYNPAMATPTLAPSQTGNVQSLGIEYPVNLTSLCL
ncbi:hypothetical protein FGB62_9g212 [Gracilaria domingensis]|nr:hypothetical protein FGB62_9g212 [Gracilaria domingensis]